MFLDNLVVTQGGEAPLRALIAEMGETLAQVPQDTPVALVAPYGDTLLAAAAHLAAARRDGMVLPLERLTPSMSAAIAAEGATIIDAESGAVLSAAGGAARPGRVWLATSGTTGQPKLIAHTWKSLFTMATARTLAPLRWLLVYQPGTYAWYQMLTLAFFTAGQSLAVSRDRTPGAMIEHAARAGVTAISATPTFWRMGLLQASASDLRRLDLKQITLGGEAVDQAILDELRGLFPRVALTHIYASTELGATIVVKDGQAGFPAAWLDKPGRQPALKLKDGTLWIESPHAGVGFGGWINTRDAVEIRGDRVFILGRADTAMINVGGDKAYAADIERRLLEHPYVRWCRVKAVSAPLVGQLVAAEIVPRPEFLDQPTPEEELTRHCIEALPAHMVPRLWRRLDEIPSGGNFKSAV